MRRLKTGPANEVPPTTKAKVIALCVDGCTGSYRLTIQHLNSSLVIDTVFSIKQEQRGGFQLAYLNSRSPLVSSTSLIAMADGK
jgi:hypothetical protein